MSVLVTGGAGYIGSVTVECLRAKGEHVVVLDDLGRGHRSAVDRDVPFYHGRVGDRALVERITSEHKIDACVHFAALAYVGESVSEPAKYFENNVEQGVALMGALVAAGVKSRGLFFNVRHVWRAESGPDSRVESAMAGKSLWLVEAPDGAIAGELRRSLWVEIRFAAIFQRCGSYRAMR